MARDQRTIVGVTIAVVGGVIVGLLVWPRLNAAPARKPARLDRVAIAAADPAVSWWETRNPWPAAEALQTIPAPAPVPTDSGASMTVPMDALWREVVSWERALRTAEPLPLATNPAAAPIFAEVEALASEYQAHLAERLALGDDRYARAVDDFIPHYGPWVAMAPLGDRLSERALAESNPELLSAASLLGSQFAARQYARYATFERVRWESTEAAWRADRDAHIEALDEAWNTQLDERLDQQLRAIAALDAAAQPDAPPLLHDRPALRSQSLAAPAAAMADELAQISTTIDAPELLPLSATESTALDTLWADYLAQRNHRLATTFAAQGYREDPAALRDATPAMIEVLTPPSSKEEGGA
ncbi:MAG: hypothetical protein ABI743_00065 [bacterium]